MTVNSDDSTTVCLVLTEDEATAIVELGAALEPFIVAGGALDTATAKADEQAAAQIGRWDTMLAEAKDQLQDDLSDLLEHEYDRIDFDGVAERVVRRLLAVYS